MLPSWISLYSKYNIKIKSTPTGDSGHDPYHRNGILSQNTVRLLLHLIPCTGNTLNESFGNELPPESALTKTDSSSCCLVLQIALPTSTIETN